MGGKRHTSDVIIAYECKVCYSALPEADCRHNCTCNPTEGADLDILEPFFARLAEGDKWILYMIEGDVAAIQEAHGKCSRADPGN